MKQTNFKRIELVEKIDLIPENKLDEIIDYIEFILSKSNIEKKKSDNLKGIWKNKGFEKISNLEDELINLRKELSNIIINRNL